MAYLIKLFTLLHDIEFTFYIRNEGNVSVDVSLNLATLTVTNGVDSAVRVAVIEDGNVDN